MFTSNEPPRSFVQEEDIEEEHRDDEKAADYLIPAPVVQQVIQYSLDSATDSTSSSNSHVDALA